MYTIRPTRYALRTESECQKADKVRNRIEGLLRFLFSAKLLGEVRDAGRSILLDRVREQIGLSGFGRSRHRSEALCSDATKVTSSECRAFSQPL
jgi:hypothetical protein